LNKPELTPSTDKIFFLQKLPTASEFHLIFHSVDTRCSIQVKKAGDA